MLTTGRTCVAGFPGRCMIVYSAGPSSSVLGSEAAGLLVAVEPISEVPSGRRLNCVRLASSEGELGPALAGERGFGTERSIVPAAPGCIERGGEPLAGAA